MRSKVLPDWSLLIVVIVGISLSSMIILSMTVDLDEPQNLIANASIDIKNIDSALMVSSTLPIRLKIPKIRVDADVEPVGIAADGSMDVPKDPVDVAWFKLGPRPGENGSSVISGHYGWKNKKPSVFDNLHKLRKGDKLYITDDLGIITTFVVREARRYDPKADASAVFASSDGKSHLNLVTCEGIWNKILKSYSKRLVVFADKEI